MKNKIFILATIITLSVICSINSFAGEAIFTDHARIIDINSQISELEEKQEHAHLMATSARELGLLEDSETISVAQNYWYEAETQKTELIEELNNIEKVEHNFTYNVFEKTNLTTTAFNKLLEGSSMANMGNAFYDMEQNYNVNGLFAISVARTESGLGVTNYAINRNNFFGLIGMNFTTPYDCIQYFGQLMNGRYYYNKTIEQIAPIYCPPTWRDWANQNKIFMRNYWDKIMSISQN